jgi:hypothetical protein
MLFVEKVMQIDSHDSNFIIKYVIMTQIKYELPVIQVQEIAQIYRKNINSPELRKIII